MAIDTNPKAHTLARKFCSRGLDLIDAVNALIALKDEKEGAGIDYAPGGTPMDFTGVDGLKHIDGNSINGVITSAIAVRDFLVTNFHDDNFYKVRP